MEVGVVLFAGLILFMASGECQNCRTIGEWCADTDGCCGGCCLQNMCIDTYEDCRTISDPCLESPCVEGSECRLYQPKCRGCNLQKECVFDPK